MKIVPVILESSSQAFTETFLRVGSFSDRIGIDIADGIAAPNKTLSLAEAIAALKSFPDILSKKIDFDLMVKNWSELVRTLLDEQANLNINSVVIHQGYFKKPPPAEFDIGLALDLADKVKLETVKKFSVVQIMTVDLGFQGGTFHPEALGKITELRQEGFAGQIIIDGGVNDQTLPLILANKGQPDVVEVGSFLTRTANPKENWQKLQTIIINHEG